MVGNKINPLKIVNYYDPWMAKVKYTSRPEIYFYRSFIVSNDRLGAVKIIHASNGDGYLVLLSGVKPKIAKIDQNGKQVWIKQYAEENSKISTIIPTADKSGYICTGYNQNNSFVFKIDQDGNLW